MRRRRDKLSLLHPAGLNKRRRALAGALLESGEGGGVEEAFKDRRGIAYQVRSIKGGRAAETEESTFQRGWSEFSARQPR